MITEKLIQQRLEKLPHRSAGYKQLIRELGLRGAERRELEDKLADMVASGKLVLTGRDRYSLPAEAAANRNLVIGRLSVHRDGYGFVTPENRDVFDRLGGDVFISPPEIGSAMHGDQVLVELKDIHNPREGRSEGRILRIMNRAQTTVVGVFHHGQRAQLSFTRWTSASPPTSSFPAAWNALPQMIPKWKFLQTARPTPSSRQANPVVTQRRVRHADRVIGDEAHRRQWDDLEGLVVEVEITQWPTATTDAKGRVIEILGYEDDFGVDVEIVIRKHHLPHRFPLSVLAEAQAVEAVIPQRELRRRRDFRALPIVTIDGETARDFDDAVTVGRLDDGNYQLQVHIADVAQYVAEESPMDREARWRGTSVYFPDRAIPMLPVELSTENLHAASACRPPGDVLRSWRSTGKARSCATSCARG